jgi:transposase-like protein
MVSCGEIRGEMVVTDEDFQRLLASVKALSQAQLDALGAVIRGDGAAVATGVAASSDADRRPADPRPDDQPIADIEARFAADLKCPGCQSRRVGKWGSANRLKRYRCKACKLTFNCLTGTPLAQLHKRELWHANAQAMVDGISLARVAARIGVHVETAFRWRHRFLKVSKTLKPKVLDGTVEADETYFLKSRKGERKLERPARKRGGKAKKRGLSSELVPVLIARDQTKATTDQILEDRSAKSISAVLEPIVAKTAVLVSDGAQAYAVFAEKIKILHVQLNLSQGDHAWGVYHIQNVNNYCSRLKTWMRRFNGVATKYLDSYLGWRRAHDREGNTLTANRLLTAAWG